MTTDGFEIPTLPTAAVSRTCDNICRMQHKQNIFIEFMFPKEYLEPAHPLMLRAPLRSHFVLWENLLRACEPIFFLKIMRNAHSFASLFGF